MRGLQTALAIAMASLMILTPVANAQETTIDNPDQSTPTTLYFHIFDTFNKFVINTQPMDSEFFEVGGNNFPSASDTPINDAYGGDFDFNTIYGYSTAGPVEYDFIEAGRPRFHPERGIAQNVLIDPDTPANAYLYLDVRDVLGGEAAPNYMPSFTFRVLMQEGDDPGIGANLDLGADIMAGEVTFNLATFDVSINPYQFWCRDVWGCADEDDPDAIPVVDNPPLPDQDTMIFPGNDHVEGQTGPDGNPIFIPADDGIVEVVIPMDQRQLDKIRKSEAYNIRIDWYQNPAGQFDEDQVSEGFFRLVADPDHLPRLEFAITNPVYLSFIHPQVAANTLLIHAGANSPWGTYDLDIDSVELSIDGPGTPNNIRKVLSSNEHVHGLHDQDAQLTYLWDFRDENAPDGEYTITMSVSNDAGTATASGEAKFIIEGDVATGIDTEGEIVAPTLDEADKEASAAGLLSALAVIAVGLLVARRRWDQ